MNILNRRQHQRGVGLIEVLVALVVIAVGVIAVLGLQGTLMSGSTTTKARNEAVALAREKTEALRNAIQRNQFDTDLAVQSLTADPDYKDGTRVDDGSGNGILNGVNAQFTRSWQIVDVAGVERTRELIMRVTWVDAQGADNKVELNTLIAYASPLASALSATAGSQVRPGGTDTGYEGLHGETPIDEEVADDRAEDDITKIIDDHFGITDVLSYSNGHVQVRIPDPLCPSVDSTDTDCTCPMVDRVAAIGGGVDCVVFTAFGGTLLRFGGIAYVENYLVTMRTEEAFNAALLVKATSPAYCAHQEYLEPPDEDRNYPPTCEDTSLDCVEYMCYASGDCTNGGADCPTDTAVLDQITARGLKGGWYGKIGYYFPEENTSNTPTRCMGKDEAVDDDGNPILDDDGNPLLADNRVAARSYHSLRNETDTDSGPFWREGINQSYGCHNTIIVDTTVDLDKVCDEGYDPLVSKGVVWNSFVNDKVIRDLDSDEVNNVLDQNNTYCVVAIYGEVLLPDNSDISDIDLGLGTGVIATPTGDFIFDPVPVTAEPDDGSVPGECVTQESKHGNTTTYIYACNFIDEAWSGTINASGTRLYDVIDENTDPPTIIPDAEFICEGVLTYVGETGRNPEQDLEIECAPYIISPSL